MKFRIEDLNIGIRCDIGSRYFLFTFDINPNHLRLICKHLEAKLFKIQNDIRDVVPDTRDRRELMQHSVDADRCDRSTWKRGKQNTAQAVADCRTVAAFQRLAYKLSVSVVFADFYNLDFRLFHVFDHLE